MNILIIGSGIAGLSCALRMSSFCDVTIVTKKGVVDTATNLAQGGIAAVLDVNPAWLMFGDEKATPLTDEAREIAIEKLRRVGLTPDVADQYPAELSGGMQKRVGLARAIAA